MTASDQLADELAEFDEAERDRRQRREADREALVNHKAGICGSKCPVCEVRNDS